MALHPVVQLAHIASVAFGTSACHVDLFHRGKLSITAVFLKRFAMPLRNFLLKAWDLEIA